MRSALLICLLVFQLSSGEHSVCLSSDAPSLIKLALLPAKHNINYQYSIANYAAPATILRNDNGTFIQGDFSTLHLNSDRNQYEYVSTGLSFKYPPQHRVAEINNEMLQLQILYQLKGDSNTAWKHRRIGLSVTFLLTEYAPQQIFTLGHQITPNLSNSTIFDLHSLLPLVPGLNVFLYKGKHTAFPEDNGFLWVVRKELLLMSEFEFEQVKSFIFEHKDREKLNYHGLLERTSDLNEISQAKPKQMPINEAPSNK